ncbi:hypothetical protein GF319_11240 [Candidatus Bathyarchaeota archaeon]|nr:hypothetical protein [Candidatus Bathyarchaeota archaeon]
MVHNRINVLGIIPGAEIGDTTHDQWIEIEVSGRKLMIFDQDMIFPEKRIGEEIDAKIGLMPVKIEKTTKYKTAFKDSYLCRVLERNKADGDFEYLVETMSLRVHMLENKYLSKGSYYVIKGRLDLISIKEAEPSGWRTIQ